MMKLSYKYKIVVLVGVWLVASFILIFYVFGWINQGSQKKIAEILELKKEQMELQAEQTSYQLAKSDLELLEKKDIKPENFFSKDTSLVNELRTIEALAEKHNLVLTLSIAGTANTLGKAKTSGELLLVPYSISLGGEYVDIVNFLKSMEKLSFITHLRTVSFGATGQGKASLTTSALFYIKK